MKLEKSKPKNVVATKLEEGGGGKALVATLLKVKFQTLPMKKIDDRRPVIFMCCEVQEKPVPNCQDTKKPMMATPQ